MKQCPHCNDRALYEDALEKCPLCNSDLIPYVRADRGNRGMGEDFGRQGANPDRGPRVISPDEHTSENQSSRDEEPLFEQRTGNRYVFRGTVAEISTHTRYYNRIHKIVNTISRGEPYQLGNTSHESVIRIEEFHNGRLATQRRDLVMYGDVEGLIQIGDDVTAWTIRRNNRYIIQNLYSHETNSDVTPGPQMPAWGILGLVLLIVGIFASLIYGMVAFIQGGGPARIVDMLVGAILGLIMEALPLLLVIGVVGWILKKFFKWW